MINDTYQYDGFPHTYKYTGHEPFGSAQDRRDTESGLDHTLYRQLSSAQGRWLSPDRVRGKVANPQSWNRYAYGGNNPCNNVDPDGALSREVPPPPDFTRFILESWDTFSGYDLFDLLSGRIEAGPFIPSPTTAPDASAFCISVLTRRASAERLRSMNTVPAIQAICPKMGHARTSFLDTNTQGERLL